jgi:long-subunit acyl-CoA synthetase (AMP-forming)
MNKPSKESMAVIMYTSGSTGKPKGVLIKHKQLLGMVAGLKVRETGRHRGEKGVKMGGIEPTHAHTLTHLTAFLA